MKTTYKEDAKIFKALCDENRLSILDLLKDGEKCACVLLEDLSISQSTLSHHMKILCESGIVSGREEGKWTYYSLSTKGCANVKMLFEILIAPTEVNEDKGE